MIKKPRRSGVFKVWKELTSEETADVDSANRNISYILHTRKPLILSSMLILHSTSIFNRLVTLSISSFANVQFKQGMKNDVPRLNFFQLIS